jgi:hypothetical protein
MGSKATGRRLAALEQAAGAGTAGSTETQRRFAASLSKAYGDDGASAPITTASDFEAAIMAVYGKEAQ